jgi:FtsP/CotA-like multicopper oxidase with cupredoxin domain
MEPGFHTSAPAPSASGVEVAPSPSPGAQASPGASPGPGAQGGGVAQYLTADAGTRSVTLKLVAGVGNAVNGFNFDGYGNGQLKVTVPAGWKVTVNCSNSATLTHSCAIVRGAQDMTPAFPGAATPNPTVGLQKGQSATFSFTPDQPGTFRIACLVPGHMDAGMWDTLTVAAAGGQPSISTGP